MILVKLKLWELVKVFNKCFGLPLTYDYATLRQCVAGNSTFRGIVYCNLGTPKTVISKFVTMRQRPNILPHVVIMTTPTMFPVDKKLEDEKSVPQSAGSN
jgi:hypothetical protein